MYAVGMIVTQSLNGAGDTLTPTGLNVICFWIVQLPLAYWLATVLLDGPDGVFLAIMLSESLLTVLSVIVFKQGAWKHKTA
jgi:Na+-driven multidrug efflux pump